ncbi:MAG: hypothetical protein IRY99_12810 [Isosphaeraceae bacterium]|nr:hypothetical protein [Isosphaeraceae bacterium]
MMIPHELLGRRVKALAWDDLRDLLPTGPSGTVTYVANCGAGGVKLTVRVEGLRKDYTFGLNEVEILPGPPGGRSTAEPV